MGVGNASKLLYRLGSISHNSDNSWLLSLLAGFGVRYGSIDEKCKQHEREQGTEIRRQKTEVRGQMTERANHYLSLTTDFDF